MSIELNNDQIYCVYDLENWWHRQDDQVFEISGRAGTGKTTVINYFIERIGLKLDEVLFVAYMGKAVNIMARNGLPAKTIHSAIYKLEEKYARDEHGKIIIKDNGKPKIKYEFVLKRNIGKNIKLIVVDEGSMVPENIAHDLLSYDIPIVALGDLNQLPPVFGEPYFLKNPNVILKQIMRQAEGNPIIWLANEVLEGRELHYGVYGSSSVIPKKDLTEFHFRNGDMILTGTNRLRHNINMYCREELKRIKKLEYPHIGEKIVCRKNNWSREIGNGIYLTNGLTGFVDYVYPDSYNKRTMKIDFRPDFTKKVFRNVEFDYKHLYEVPGKNDEDGLNKDYGFYYDKIEFAYALSTYLSQGSQWDSVLYLHEDFMRDKEDRKRHIYTAITRAAKQINIVI